MRRLLCLLFILGCTSPSMAGSVPPPPPTPNVAPFLPYSLATRHGGWHIIGRNSTWSVNFGSNAGTDIGGTSRYLVTTTGAVSTLRLHFFNSRPGGSNDCAGINPVIMRCSIEYPLGTGIQQVAVNGQTTWVVGADNPGTWSDPIGIVIPTGTQFGVRTYVRVSNPPTSPSATTTSTTILPGNLSTSTTYFYKITSIDNGIESGPSSEVSASPTVGNAAVLLSWTTNAFATAYKIYRSTATGTEVFLTSVNAPQAQWTDTGAIAPGTATPPALQKYCLNRSSQSGESNNYVVNAGNGSDQTGATGALSSVNGVELTPDLIIGDDANNTTLACLGDSIGSSNGTSPVNPWLQNWFDFGITTTSNSSSNLALSGTKCSDIAVANANSMRWRMSQLIFSDYVVSNLGINDLAAGSTWQTLATNQLTIAKICNLRGQRYCLTTLTPNTTDTQDNWVLIANQATKSYETNRQNYNTWLRNGCEVSAGSPVLTGGTPSPYIFAIFDVASYVEVNASNVLTLNGGFWRVPASAALTGQAATGTPTTTSITISGAAYTSGQYVNYAAYGTSGVNNGVGRLITANNATTLTVSAFPSAPASGDTFSIYQIYVQDGTHLTDFGHSTVGTQFASFITSKVVTFGAP